MSDSLQTIIYPVRDLARAKTLYGTAFGVQPYIDQPYYVAFDAGGQDVGLDPHGHAHGAAGPVAYWHVDDIRARMKALLDAGAQPQQDVRDVGGGKLIASVRDADGNVIGLMQSP